MKIIISGPTHGIGKVTAEKFVAEGWEVFGCGSNIEDQRGMRMADLYPNFHFMHGDVSSEEDMKRFFQWCGPVDAAFNNAGIGCEPRPMHLLDVKAAKRILEVNLFGTALCMKYECAYMLEAAGGVIVNNSSVSAFRADTGADALYSASKAGILRLTAEAAVRKEYRDKIKFFTLVPGWIETRMTAADNKDKWKERLPSGQIGTAGQVAELVYTIVTGKDSFDSGQEFHVNGGGILV